MKLKRFLLRYHPPGIILEYLRKNGEVETKSIDLLNLTPEYVPRALISKFLRIFKLICYIGLILTGLLIRFFWRSLSFLNPGSLNLRSS